MDRVLQDKVAIVTGGGQGLGQAICWRLAREGCHVVVADVNAETAVQTAAAINEYRQGEGQTEVPGTSVRSSGQEPGPSREAPTDQDDATSAWHLSAHVHTGERAIAIKVDVTDEGQVEAMVQRTVEEFGRLDILVSNAGILIAGEISEFSADKWRAVVDVNLVGYFLCAKHAARIMKAQRSGVIIQINSKSGKKGSYKNSAYAASKFGGIGLTQSIALELAEYGVRVNAVCPGNLLDSPLWVDSLYKQYAQRLGITEEEVRQKYIDQVPMRRGCTYEDVCNVVVFLASDQASYMTGQAINVTGGQEMG